MGPRKYPNLFRLCQRADNPQAAIVPSDNKPSISRRVLPPQIAAVGDYLVALATYKAAVKRWPNALNSLH